MAALGQTRIIAPKNKYKVEEDVKVGRQAAVEVERKFPIINDRDATNYIERVGQRLVSAIPSQFDQPAFDYRFKWVNANDLNAFALPGGPMYIIAHDRLSITDARCGSSGSRDQSRSLRHGRPPNSECKEHLDDRLILARELCGSGAHSACEAPAWMTNHSASMVPGRMLSSKWPRPV